YEGRHEAVGPWVVVQIFRTLAQRAVRIGRVSGRHPDIDGQVLPGGRVMREVAARLTAVFGDDVVQIPLSAAVLQIDGQLLWLRGHGRSSEPSGPSVRLRMR